MYSFLVSHLLFLPQSHFDAVHRHHDADFLLFDVLGLEFILEKHTKSSESEKQHDTNGISLFSLLSE